jgi:hypothetical protein
MRIIDGKEITLHPNCCAVTRRTEGRFVDFQQEIACHAPPFLYLLDAVVEEAARKLGMPSKQEYEDLKDELAKWTADFDQLKTELANLKDTLELSERVGAMNERITEDATTDSQSG